MVSNALEIVGALASAVVIFIVGWAILDTIWHTLVKVEDRRHNRERRRRIADLEADRKRKLEEVQLRQQRKLAEWRELEALYAMAPYRTAGVGGVLGALGEMDVL
jgi:Co/Zn/Cd efflux system component